MTTQINDFLDNKLSNENNYKENNNITDEEHINNIHKMQLDIENNICPRCGAKLVIRNGDYGEFYGCSNYPKCRYTQK